MADSQQQVVQRIAMKAVIVNDAGEVLILREASTYDEGTNTGRYHMPGGRLNPGEPFLDGLSREVMEETGLTVSVERPLYVGEWFPVIKGVPNQIVAVFFVCKAAAGEVRLSEEHDDFQWISADDAAKYDLMDPEDKVLREYFTAAA